MWLSNLEKNVIFQSFYQNEDKMVAVALRHHNKNNGTCNQILIQFSFVHKKVKSPCEWLASVVQKVNSAIHLIKFHPLGGTISFPNACLLDSDLSCG